DPYSLCHALFVETVIRSWRRELGSRPAAAAEAIALSDTQGWPFYLGLARAYRAAALGASGASPSAVAEVSAGMTLVEARAQSASPLPLLNALLAEVQLVVGDPKGGLGAVERGLAASARTGHAYWDAELHRLKGEVLLQSQAENQAEAERLFRRALEIARAQEAKCLELRTAMSLARLLRARGCIVEAREVLAPVYTSFTEGFD